MIEKSFYLIRTNPALTTNVKIVITSNSDLYLESYSANRTLSEERFKHFKINKENWLFEEIPAFFTGVPSETAYYVKSVDDDAVMYDDFANQFDDMYFSGAYWAEDTFYDEEYEYIAPLWIKKDYLPKGFIIFRIDGSGLTDGNDPSTFRTDILDKWKIIDYYDLTEDTDIGKYIRTQINHELFPEVALDVHFEDLRLTKFYGIDYFKSGYVSKSIHLENKYKLNTPIFHSEEYFTDQWKNLGLIFPFIWNIKFLFDDTPATPTSLRKWSLNRYAGFYIDDIEEIKTVSPYQPFALNKIPVENLQQLTPSETSEIPYLLNNTFVQDIGFRRFTFDPILGGWQEGKIYYIEWQGEFYKLERVENDDPTIIGKYTYKVISPINIEYDVPEDITNTQLQAIYKKVLINELTTLKYQIEIIDSVIFENIEGKNIIEYTNTTFTTLKRNFQQYIEHGQLVWGFTITLEAEIDNNLFSIENFDDTDLVIIEINNKKYVIKRYPDTIPNIGGKYYIQSDEAIKITKKYEEIWINNGIYSKDPDFYHYKNIEQVKKDQYPITYTISRVSFLDVKDFDFDRIDTKYTNYEYELENSITESLEPKLFGKDRRHLSIKVEKPKELNADNFTNDSLKEFLLSDPHSYTEWYKQDDSDGEITDKNGNKRRFNTFEEYIDFKWNNIINVIHFSISGVVYNDPTDPNSKSLTVKEYQERLPLYINPTRIPILDESGEQVLDPDTGYPLWQKDWKGDFIYTQFSKPIVQEIDLDRKWYREEGYILLLEDNENEQDKYLDFLTKTEPKELKIDLPWNDANNNDYRTHYYPMAYTMTWSPYSKSVTDPHQTLDTNYVPVSSEYVTSEELFEIRNNKTHISPILGKNQYVCKWGALNSIGHADYPYRLNYDLDVGGEYNIDSNAITNIPYAVRQYKDLDYFYRFGLTNLPETYKYYSLHLKDEYFDIDKYIIGEFDYFDWLFNTDILTTDGLLTTKKYSVFSNGNDNNAANTIFKGIKYYLYDIKEIKFNEEYLNENLQIIEDYVKEVNTKYNNYKFSIVLGRKLTKFKYNSGDNDGDFGIDVYLNDKYKNVVVHLYFETDFPVTFRAYNADSTTLAYNIDNPPPAGKTTEELIAMGYVPYVLRNLETAILDELYDADTIVDKETNENYWELGKVKLNDIKQIGDIRIRNLRLFEFLTILNDYNYDPLNGSGRRAVQYIHIYEDGSVNFFNTTNTDFTIDFDLPQDFLIKSDVYKVDTYHESALQINNSIKNRIILDDDPNSVTGDPNYTSKGALVNSITDINAWDGYPIARIFSAPDNKDKREIYDLSEKIDPKIYRHSSAYVPIFKDLQLFRPASYWTITSSSVEYIPTLSAKNWKFYDDFSDGNETGKILTSFGYIDEIVYSKCNLNGNILKLAQLNEADKRSIYPMVDECGYSVSARYVFQSTWDSEFFISSRLLEMPKNEYPGKAGYCVYFNGINSKLVVDDVSKFNIVPDKYETLLDIDPQDEFDVPYDGKIFVNYNSAIAHEGNIFKQSVGLIAANGWIIFNNVNYSRIELQQYTNDIKDIRIEVTFQLLAYNTNINTIYSFSNSFEPRGNELLVHVNSADKHIYLEIGNTINIHYDTLIDLTTSYTLIVERINGIFKTYLNGVQLEKIIYDDRILKFTSGTLGQEQDSDWGGYDSNQALIGKISYFSINTPDALTDLDLMNMINDASLDPDNWTRGRSGGGELIYDPIENSLKYTYAGQSYFEYNTNIRLKPGQKVEMTVSVKSRLLNDPTNVHQTGQRFYCGVRTYGAGFNGSTSSLGSGDVGGNDGHIYFVASAVLPISYPNYTTYKGVFTCTSSDLNCNIPNTSWPSDMVYVRPMILLNYYSSNDYNNGKYYDPANPNTMWIKDFSFKIINNDLKTKTTLFNLDFLKPLKFSLLNVDTNIIKQYELPHNGYNYIFSDEDSFVTAFNKKDDRIVMVSTENIKYLYSSNYTDEYNFNGELYTTYRNISGNNSYAKTIMNSSVADGDIMFDLLSENKGAIYLSYNIDDIYSFNLEDFKISLNKQLEPNYTLNNVILTDQNINYEIVAINTGVEYNFEIMSYHNAVENTAEHINAKATEHIIQYSKLGLLRYVGEDAGENKTVFYNKAIKSITIEFWLNVKNFNIENQTILHKGSQTNVHNYSWVIRRYKQTNKIEFITRSYIMLETDTLNSIDPTINSVYINSVVADFDFDDGLWHHVAFVFDSNNHKKIIYVDGQRNAVVNNINLTNIVIDPNSDAESKDWDLSIGSDNNNSAVNFYGYIDELRLWNYARSEHEIFKNYDLLITPSAYLDPFKSLIGYWKFDEQLGSLIYDNSIYAFNLKENTITTITKYNNGQQLITKTTVDVKNDILELYDNTNTNINQDGSNIEWFVSGADIRGVSDERYEVDIPASTTSKKVINLDIVDATPSNRVYIDEIPKNESKDKVISPTPVAPIPPDIIEPPTPIPVPPPTPIDEHPKPVIPPPLEWKPPHIKLFKLPIDLFKRKRQIVKRPKKINKREHLLEYLNKKIAIKKDLEFSVHGHTGMEMNDLDQYSKMRQRLNNYSNETEKAMLDKRVNTIRTEPIKVLKNEVKTITKPTASSVQVGKNSRNVISRLRNLFKGKSKKRRRKRRR